jgi:translation elongation factor EF-Ts
MKGISSQEVLMGKNKKKKEEVKRINDLVELKVQEHLNDFRLQEQKYIQDTQFMQQQLYEEGLKITELENELAEYRAYVIFDCKKIELIE